MRNTELQALASLGVKHLGSRYIARSTEVFLFTWGDAPGIEVRSTESRCEALWIEVRTTEAFNLNWAVIEVRSTESRQVKVRSTLNRGAQHRGVSFQLG